MTAPTRFPDVVDERPLLDSSELLRHGPLIEWGVAQEGFCWWPSRRGPVPDP